MEYITEKSRRVEEKEWHSDFNLYSEFSMTCPQWLMAASVPKVSYWKWQPHFPSFTESQKLDASLQKVQLQLRWFSFLKDPCWNETMHCFSD